MFLWFLNLSVMVVAGRLGCRLSCRCLFASCSPLAFCSEAWPLCVRVSTCSIDQAPSGSISISTSPASDTALIEWCQASVLGRPLQSETTQITGKNTCSKPDVSAIGTFGRSSSKGIAGAEPAEREAARSSNANTSTNNNSNNNKIEYC